MLSRQVDILRILYNISDTSHNSSAATSTAAANAGGLNPDDGLQDANILDAAAELAESDVVAAADVGVSCLKTSAEEQESEIEAVDAVVCTSETESTSTTSARGGVFLQELEE